MKVPAIARLIQLRKTSPLNERVMALHVCPDCHSRTLEESSRNEDGRWLQCRRCRKIFLHSFLEVSD